MQLEKPNSKRITTCFMLFVITTLLSPFAWASSSLPHEAMPLVNDNWIARNQDGRGLDPGRATYQLGNLALYHTFCTPEGLGGLDQTTCDAYLQHTLNWANRHNWQLHSARKEADNQAVGQVYIELYELCQEPSLSDSLRQRCDQTSDTFKLDAISQSIDQTIIICIENTNDRRCPGTQTEKYDWSWIDAIFMSGPVFSKFGADASLPHTLGS